MATTKANIDISVKGQAELDRLQTSMNKLNGVFAKFKAVVAGAAFASFARGALQMADAVQDLADVTGIASDRILAFQNAVQYAGGSAELGSKGLLTFYQSINDAVNGSIGAQAAFSQLGVTLQDLGQLSEAELFTKTVEQLASMPQSAQKAALQADLLGKAFRGVTIDAKFVQTLKDGEGEASKMSRTIQRAADLNEAWEKSFFKIRLAFLEAFGPLISNLGKLLEMIPNLVTAFKILGAVIAVAFAVSGIRALVGVLGMVVRGVTLLISGLSKIGQAFAGLGKSSQALGKLRDLFSAIVAPIAAVAAYFGFFTGEEKKATDATEENTAATEENRRKQAEAAEAHRRVVSAVAEKIRALQANTRAFAEQNAQNIDAINLENQLLGKSKEYIDTVRAQEEVIKRSAAEIQKLTDAKANLSEEEKQLGLGAEYDKQIAKIKELTDVETKRLESAIKNSSRLQAIEELRKFGLSTEIDLQKKLTDLADETAKIGLTEIEKKYYDISAAARDSARAAIQAEAARRGINTLPLAEQEQYYRKALEGQNKLKASTKALYDQSRTFGTGWKKAWNDYVDAATNAAAQAERIFNKFTTGIEDALVDFAKTGKLNWKQFVADMAEELLRSQIKQTIASLGSALGLGSLFGGSGGTVGDSPSNPMYVSVVGSGGMGGGQDVLGNFINSLGGNKTSTVSGGGIGGGSNILGSLGNIVGSVGSAVKSVGSGIWDTVSSIGSTIGGLFDGWFANGGTIGAGKFGIVGENGPELIGGPANITPLGAGGTTNVYYTINAVDTRSFQQLLAQDPSIIYALTEQGRKSIAGAR